jgi:hypothetical protein
MTLQECKDAQVLAERLAHLRGALRTVDSTQYLSTVPIATGYGKETVTVPIDSTMVHNILEHDIAAVLSRLHTLGIEDEEAGI